MQFGLHDDIVAKVNGIFAKYKNVEEVILYGSRAKGNYRNGSDIDLTLKGDRINLHIMNEISLEIDDLLLPYTFDLSVYHQIASDELIDHINRVGMVFYKKP